MHHGPFSSSLRARGSPFRAPGCWQAPQLGMRWAGQGAIPECAPFPIPAFATPPTLQSNTRYVSLGPSLCQRHQAVTVSGASSLWAPAALPPTSCPGTIGPRAPCTHFHPPPSVSTPATPPRPATCYSRPG